jgi:hypothetical protein
LTTFRYFANLLTETTQWEAPSAVSAPEDFGEFQDGGDVAQQQQQHFGAVDDDIQLAAAIALSLEGAGEGAEVVEFGDFQDPVVEHQCLDVQQQQQQQHRPPVDLFSFEKLDSPKGEFKTAAAAAAATTSSAAMDLLNFDDVTGDLTTSSLRQHRHNEQQQLQNEQQQLQNEQQQLQNEQQQLQNEQQQLQQRFDPSQLLLQFRSSEQLDLQWEPTHTTLSFGAAAVAADGDDESHGDIDGVVGNADGGADDDGSSDSEWGEFASFDEATPSKRG